MNTQLEQILRVSTEPYAYVSDAEVHALLTRHPKNYFRDIKQALTDIATGAATLELPPKQIFSDVSYQGDWRVMPCQFVRNRQVCKTMKLVGTNIEQTVVPDQITVGKAFAIHPRDNYITHIFEACLLSSARTGLCATLAVDLLTEKTQHIMIIGSGRVGYYTALYISNNCDVEQIRLYDRDKQRAQQIADSLAKDIQGVQFCAVNTADTTDADVVILATSSTTPLLSPDDTNASLVISLGADTNDQHELHSEWARTTPIFIDTLDSVRYGDLRLWQEQEMLSTDDLVDLFDLLRSNSNHNDRRVFISTGSALFDNLTIAYMLANKQESGVD